MEGSQKVLKQLKTLKAKLSRYTSLYSEWEDMKALVELAIEADDDTMLSEIQEGYDTLTKDLETLRLETLLSGTYDANNAILALHAAACRT